MDYITVKEAAEKWKISERMVRKYCEQGKFEGVIHAGSVWILPMDAAQPNEVSSKKVKVTPFANKVMYQRNKGYHYGIYEFIQVNLAYSSSRMASNRLTRQQVMDVYRTGKVSVAFEPMKVDDLVEIANHFRCVQYMVDTLAEPLTSIYIRKLHQRLFRGTKADQEGEMRTGEFRKNLFKYGTTPATLPIELMELIKEYEQKKKIELSDILDFHARFESIRPCEDGNGRLGRVIIMKECLRHGIAPFIIDDKHRGEYLRGIKMWNADKSVLTCLVEQAQLRFEGQKDICDLMEYCRPTSGRGAR